MWGKMSQLLHAHHVSYSSSIALALQHTRKTRRIIISSVSDTSRCLQAMIHLEVHILRMYDLHWLDCTHVDFFTQPRLCSVYPHPTLTMPRVKSDVRELMIRMTFKNRCVCVALFRIRYLPCSISIEISSTYR